MRVFRLRGGRVSVVRDSETRRFLRLPNMTEFVLTMLLAIAVGWPLGRYMGAG